ncbi:MAG: hypothetical protein ABUL62_28445 [Myxococcales bacterium]|jgi:hypothetical protein
MHISTTKQALARAITSVVLLFSAGLAPLACLGRNDCTGANGLCLYPVPAMDGGGPALESGGRAGTTNAGALDAGLSAISGGSSSTMAGAADAGSRAGNASTHEVRLPVDAVGGVGAPELGIGGGWFPMADAYGVSGTTADGLCELAGHPASSCAAIVTPANLLGGIPNQGGVLCTSGSVEQVLDTPAFPNGDYGNMWGAGLGFVFYYDAHHMGGSDAARIPYDAPAHGVVGIAFDLDRIPQPGLRVGFSYAASTNEAAIWKQELPSFNSPVQVGHNVVLFDDVKPATYLSMPDPFDSAQLINLQLMITTNPDPSSARRYAFCVSNFSVVVED